MLRYGTFETPLGPMVAVVDGAGALTHLDFLEDVADAEAWLARNARGAKLRRGRGAIGPIAAAMDEYFTGHRHDFADVALAARGTPFQKQVWDELCRIPYGTTISYGELAVRIGRPSASRAVGRANGTNPIAVVVPCHRVIGSTGDLTGYAGGLAIKAALLALEGALPEPRGGIVPTLPMPGLV
ncbi:MAG: methylated-DNA--[protein]-cysteine S-methyltransferase [Alphaproteobacteria bacterium]|nr:methylated-DNA--[protein]-cysteine S-methyltransferase [Alphaproteobacteria bacterium]